MLQLTSAIVYGNHKISPIIFKLSKNDNYMVSTG